MKKILPFGLPLVLMAISVDADALKMKDWLSFKKQEANDKVNNKINQKT